MFHIIIVVFFNSESNEIIVLNQINEIVCNVKMVILQDILKRISRKCKVI